MPVEVLESSRDLVSWISPEYYPLVEQMQLSELQVVVEVDRRCGRRS